jgi:hypothetical protein
VEAANGVPAAVDDDLEGQRKIAGVRDGMRWTTHAELALPEHWVRQREARIEL